MKSKTSNSAKYIGSALAIGGTIMLGSGLISEHSSLKKKAKKTASKAIDTIDYLVSGMQNIIG